MDSIGSESNVISILLAFAGTFGFVLIVLLVAWIRQRRNKR